MASLNEESFIMPTKLIPRCPQCNSPLVPNIRNSEKFIEKHWIENYPKMNELVKANRGKNILLLELGVGMNTPGIIRFPFEFMALQRRNTILCRINKSMGHLSLVGKKENAILITADIGDILTSIKGA